MIAGNAPGGPQTAASPPPRWGASAWSGRGQPAVSEVASMPAFALVDMPEPFALELEHRTNGPAYVSVHGYAYAMLRAQGCAVFVGVEWTALVIGAEAGRATAQECARYLEIKRKTPQRLLEERHTLGGVRPDTGQRRRRATVQSVSAEWGLKLISVSW